MKRLHILVVDDDDNMLALWIRRLAAHQIEIAHNGAEALEMLRGDLDLVVSDLEMPVLDGIAFLTRAREAVPHVPRFLCTGSDPDRAETAVADGIADRYFAKPESLGELLRAVHALEQ
jgi:CheY-like chemotaxis protein